MFFFTDAHRSPLVEIPLASRLSRRVYISLARDPLPSNFIHDRERASLICLAPRGYRSQTGKRRKRIRLYRKSARVPRGATSESARSLSAHTVYTALVLVDSRASRTFRDIQIYWHLRARCTRYHAAAGRYTTRPQLPVISSMAARSVSNFQRTRTRAISCLRRHKFRFQFITDGTLSARTKNTMTTIHPSVRVFSPSIYPRERTRPIFASR